MEGERAVCKVAPEAAEGFVWVYAQPGDAGVAAEEEGIEERWSEPSLARAGRKESERGGEEKNEALPGPGRKAREGLAEETWCTQSLLVQKNSSKSRRNPLTRARTPQMAERSGHESYSLSRM